MNLIKDIPDYIVYYLAIETTKILLEKQDNLKSINWTYGESNIDVEYSTLACQCCIEAWNIIKKQYIEYNDVIINCKIPDINIEFILPTNRSRKIIKKKIELKSSKTIKIPGSTIKNLDINQPLIYCLRPSNDNELYKFRCSQYYNAIGETNYDLFQDRTPRPIINFDKMYDQPYIKKEKNDWINHYAICAINRLKKNKIQKSWQDDLVKIIQQETIIEFIKNTTIEEFQDLKLSQELSSIKL